MNEKAKNDIQKEKLLNVCEGQELPCAYVIMYVCKRDILKAFWASQMLPKAKTRITWVVESKDKDLPVPAGVRLVVRDFPRGGQLRYFEALVGMREVFLEAAEEMGEQDLLVKLDSDTCIFNFKAIVEPFFCAGVDFTYIRRHFNEGRLLANGCCYAVSKRALLRLRNMPIENFKDKARRFDGHEDLIFSSIWTTENTDLTLCQLDKARCHWNYLNYFGKDCLLAHYGYIKNDETLELLEKHCAITGNSVPDISAFLEKVKEFIANAKKQ